MIITKLSRQTGPTAGIRDGSAVVTPPSQPASQSLIHDDEHMVSTTGLPADSDAPPQTAGATRALPWVEK